MLELVAYVRAREMTVAVAVCRADNIASIRTVEKCGARLATFADPGGVRVHHYLFELG